MTSRDTMVDPVTDDLQVDDEITPPGLEHLYIDSQGSGMLGVMFTVRGKGPHPTAVILHGFPGHERNLDLAHVLRRAGWNSVVFHYRGAWGSEGSFTFSHMLEDVRSCLSYLRSDKWKYIVDRERITLIGHSMGSWAAFMTAAKDPGIRQVASFAGFNLGAMKVFLMDDEILRMAVTAVFEELSRPLKGADPPRLIHEIVENGDRWDMNGIVEKLKGKRILMIGASRDQVAVPEIHHLPTSLELKKTCGDNARVLEIDSDHNFSDRRIELSRTVVDWLKDGQ
ncbi:MAG: alpha/beta fold hydrolase [Candidatus Thermoplasmatota archaeon]|nr:alpha/beta fold hydrolase [Candidatus Thermoplasmatota archaeon]